MAKFKNLVDENWRVCNKCLEYKTWDNYFKRTWVKSWYMSFCKDCDRIKHWRQKKKVLKIKEYWRQCTHCLEFKSYKFFQKNRTIKTWYKPICKECMKTKPYNKTYKVKDPERKKLRQKLDDLYYKNPQIKKNRQILKTAEIYTIQNATKNKVERLLKKWYDRNLLVDLYWRYLWDCKSELENFETSLRMQRKYEND